MCGDGVWFVCQPSDHLAVSDPGVLFSSRRMGGVDEVVCYNPGCLTYSTWFTQHIPLLFPFYSQLHHPLVFHPPSLWVHLPEWVRPNGLRVGDQGQIMSVSILSPSTSAILCEDNNNIESLSNPTKVERPQEGPGSFSSSSKDYLRPYSPISKLYCGVDCGLGWHFFQITE